jgi:REP element-mobilizing transposase RayT
MVLSRGSISFLSCITFTSMARKPRLHVPGGLYHIIWRGNRQQNVFVDDEDRERFYALLSEGVERFGYRVHGYCLMGNHIHLAVQAGKEPLSGPLHNLAFRYTQAVNRRSGRAGHLFQGRYQALLVDHDAYLLELVRYIHLNPVRAHLVREPAEYQWSGHRAYLGLTTLPWLTTDTVLGQLGGTLNVARRRYARFIGEGMDQGHRPEFYAGDQDSRIVGTDRFIERLRQHISIEKHKPVSLDEVVAHVCAGYGVDEHALAAPGRQRITAQARALIGWLALHTKASTLVEVSRRYGREPSGLSRQVARLDHEGRTDARKGRALQRHLNAINQAGRRT